MLGIFECRVAPTSPTEDNWEFRSDSGGRSFSPRATQPIFVDFMKRGLYGLKTIANSGSAVLPNPDIEVGDVVFRRSHLTQGTGAFIGRFDLGPNSREHG